MIKQDLDAQINNSLDNSEFNEPTWFIELKNNYNSFFFNCQEDANNVESSVDAAVFQAPSKIEEDQFTFKQPNPIKSNNKRKYQNREHSTEQIVLNNQHEFNNNNSSTFEKQRKQSFDFSNSLNINNENVSVLPQVQMYQLPNGSSSDYTLNNEQFMLTTVPAATMSSTPTTNQIENENNYNNDLGEQQSQIYENNNQAVSCI